MNNEMILHSNSQNLGFSLSQLKTVAERPIQLLTLYYNKVLDRQLDMRQMRSLINAQLAFFMTVFPADCPLLLRMVCGCWLITALLKCKEIL